MTARQTDKRRERECQLYVTAEGVEAGVLNGFGCLISVRSTDFHPQKGKDSGNIKPGFG